MRYLGIDLGDVRTGLALSDPQGIICSPLEILTERDQEQLLLKIIQLAKEHKAGKIIVGLPRPLKGGTNLQAEKVLHFVEDLVRATSLPIDTWDERFTSRLAQAHKGSEKAQDSIAACYMLQNYMDAQICKRGEK